MATYLLVIGFLVGFGLIFFTESCLYNHNVSVEKCTKLKKEKHKNPHIQLSCINGQKLFNKNYIEL